MLLKTFKFCVSADPCGVFHIKCGPLADKLVAASLVCRYGILCRGDGSADYYVIGAYFLCLGGGHNSLLVTDVTVGKSYSGGNGDEVLAASFVYLFSLKG